MWALLSISRRWSRRWASATKMGLPATCLPFMSLDAAVASSGAEKHTKPKPLLLPSLLRMTRLLVMVP